MSGIYGIFRDRIERQDEARSSVPVVDMHLHLVDFLQDTDGMQTLLKLMTEANIEKSVVFGLPVKKKWMFSEPNKPSYYLDDDTRCYYFASTDEIVAGEYMRLDPEDAKRIAPTICGFNPTDLCAIDYVDHLFAKYPFWRGVGELLLRHDDLTHLTHGEPARINHPALRDVFAFCGEKSLPVCVHQNATSACRNDEYEYLHEMRETLEGFPRTTFVWAHCGASRRVTGKNYVRMLAEMLQSYKNLCVDISWVVYDVTICRRHVPEVRWIKLIHKYPERIMMGTDMCGHFDLLGQTIARYNTLINQLPESIIEMITRRNAERLWFPSG